MKNTLILILTISFLFFCKKDEAPSGSQTTNTTTNTCSTLGTIQDTIVNNGTKYCIVATSGANTELLIELVKYNGAYATNLSINFLDAINGINCYESSNVTEMIGPQYKVYKFGSFPSWTIDTNTVSIAKITIDSTVYYLRDRKLNRP